MKTTAKGLSSYQKQQIIFLATTNLYSEPKRIELLRSRSYCTDNVKFEVLESSEQVSKRLYTRLSDMYFDSREYKKWTAEETSRLIDCYNRNIHTHEMMRIFGVSRNTIDCRICYLKKKPEYRDLFTLHRRKKSMEAKAWTSKKS